MPRELKNGIYAMLVTPFNAHEDIDFGALRAEIDWCARQGADGIVVTPSIGEFACLSEKERIGCFGRCAEYARLEYPNLILVATTAGTHTREVLHYTGRAKEMGYDACQLIPPYYWHPDGAEVIRHYELAAETGLPIIVYHNPALSKVYLSRKMMGRLVEIPGVVAIKEVKTDRHVELEPLFKIVEGRAKVFNTFRAFTTGLMLGSAGGFINVFALPFCVKMWELFQKGDLESFKRMEEIQNMVNEVFPRGGEDNKRHIGTTKMAASVVTGINMGPPRSPYLLPDPKFEEILRENLPALYDLCS